MKFKEGFLFVKAQSLTYFILVKLKNLIDSEDLLVPYVEDEAVAAEADNCNEAVYEGTQKDNAVPWHLKFGPMTRNYLGQKIFR